MKIDEAIELLKELVNDLNEINANEGYLLQDGIKFDTIQAIEIVLNRLQEFENQMEKELILENSRTTYEVNELCKDKIREKIKEKEREIQEFIGTDNTGRFTRDNCRITDEVNVLKELLEED